MTSAAQPKIKPISRAKNVLANWGGFIFTAGINFVLAPFVVHSLGDVAYGIWVLLGSLVGYLGLLDLGVRGAVTRYVAKYHAQGDHLESTRVASSALAIFFLTGVIATFLASVMAIFVGKIFQIPPELVSVARIVIILGGMNMAVSMVSGVWGGIIAGLQRFDYSNTVEIVIGALRALAIVLALKSGFGLLALAAIQLGMSLLRGLASYLISRWLYPQLKIRLSECRRSHLSMIFSFSISILLVQASGMLINFTDSVVIGAFLPIGMVTLFAIAANLTEYARAPINGITYTLTPWASTLEAKEDFEGVQRVILDAARISTLVALPIILTFMLRGRTFIDLWMGPEYATPSGNVLWVLSIALWVSVGYQVMVATMMGISKHNGLVPVFIVEAITNIGLSIFWLHNYGIIGVAWGTTVPRLVVALFFGPWYARRVLGTPISKFWRAAWIRPTLAMIPFGVGSLLIERWWPVDNLILYFAQVALILPLAGLGAWVLSMKPSEKERFIPKGSLKRLAGRIAP